MKKNPYVNAVLATLYITCISLLMFYGPKMITEQKDTFIMPIAMISLFTLSAAVMCYLFVFEPFMLFQSGEKKAAVNFFLKTLATFACITLVIFVVMFLGIV